MLQLTCIVHLSSLSQKALTCVEQVDGIATYRENDFVCDVVRHVSTVSPSVCVDISLFLKRRAEINITQVFLCVFLHVLARNGTVSTFASHVTHTCDAKKKASRRDCKMHAHVH